MKVLRDLCSWDFVRRCAILNWFHYRSCLFAPNFGALFPYDHSVTYEVITPELYRFDYNEFVVRFA